MFKFMKSKKGFSLVELMIVVVIMAILVAVAVPIFNSVTGSARQKTCIDNQRQIMTAISNLYMGEGVSGGVTNTKPNTYSFTVKGNVMTVPADTDLATFEGKASGTAPSVTQAEIKGSFKTAPCCGDENYTIKATVTANPGGTATVSTACYKDDNCTTQNTDHVVKTTS